MNLKEIKDAFFKTSEVEYDIELAKIVLKRVKVGEDFTMQVVIPNKGAYSVISVGPEMTIWFLENQIKSLEMKRSQIIEEVKSLINKL